jgi:hypothetical protein
MVVRAGMRTSSRQGKMNSQQMVGQVLSWLGQIVWVRGMLRDPRSATAAQRDV